MPSLRDLLPWGQPQSGAGQGGPDAAPSRPDVIVVGAGIAGLACARKLGQAGKRVLLLEGRDRLGGRIHSAPFVGVNVDLGASWIHCWKGNPITDLANEAGARLVRTNYDNLELYDSDGRELKGREYKTIDQVCERAMEDLLRARRGAGRDQSLEPVVARAFDTPDLTPTERRGVRWGLTSDISCAYASELRDLSLSQWDEDEEYGGADHQFAGGGYGTIIDFLAKGCSAAGVDIRTSAAVQAVDWSSSSVKVRTSAQEFEAPQVVMTLPLGVLKRGTVQFQAPLPDAKQGAIKRLGVGTLNKVVMSFDEMFWDDEAEYFGRLSDDDDPHIDYWNLEPVTSKPILAALIGGDAAVRLEGMSDRDIVRTVLSPLRTVFDDDVEEPRAVTITRWAGDPFACGSYSHVRPGSSYDDYDAIARPISGRLFFAGEATSVDYPSTTHGALGSGERAAREVLR